MRSLNTLNKSSFIVILLNLAGLGVLGFLGIKLYGDTVKIVEAYQNLYTTARDKEDLRIVSGILEETIESRDKVAKAWLRAEDLILFIEKLEGLAKTAGVQFDLDEPKPVIGKQARLDLTFSTRGSFSNLHHFLILLENLPYRFDWQNLSWSFESGTTWSGNFSLSLISYLDHYVTP